METATKPLSLLDISDFGSRSLIDILAIILLVGFIYYPKYKNKDFIFTFVLFNIINFMICYLLGAAKIKIGFAFGLFAIFSIIRYRTIMVSIKDMGYFFVCVALGMLNSLATVTDGFVVLISCNLIILILTYFLERLNFMNNENYKEIVYDNVQLIKPANREDLINDLKERTGLDIHKVDVISINYLKDTVLLKAYYFAKESENTILNTSDDD